MQAGLWQKHCNCCALWTEYFSPELWSNNSVSERPPWLPCLTYSLLFIQVSLYRFVQVCCVVSTAHITTWTAFSPAFVSGSQTSTLKQWRPSLSGSLLDCSSPEQGPTRRKPPVCVCLIRGGMRFPVYQVYVSGVALAFIIEKWAPHTFS